MTEKQVLRRKRVDKKEKAERKTTAGKKRGGK